jgi:hypothetical protein
MAITNTLFISRKLFFLLVVTFFSYQLDAQNQSFGGGIGINSLLANGVNLSQNGRSRLGSPDENQKAFSKPQMSLNIDYNFPNKLSNKWSNKWLGKIYNPIFSNPHLQLRGQAMFNQFRIDALKSNSILSFGVSLLYFLKAQDALKKFNFFIETGYKAAWNNETLDPFNCFILGMGTRLNIGNDWILQPSISYTLALNDYVDLYGAKGFSVKPSEGYVLFNISILKPFFNVAEKGALDRAKDSLGMARSFAVQAIEKGRKVAENVKIIQESVKPLFEKTLKDKALANKITETALAISDKAISIRLNLKKSKRLDTADREIDSLKTLTSTLSIDRLVDYDLAKDVHVIERDIAKKLQELERDLQEAKQNLKWTYQYLPFLKDLEKEVQRINVKEGGEARIIITKVEQVMGIAQKEYEAAHNNVAGIKNLFEKAGYNLNNAIEEVEKTEKEMANLKKH